MEAIFCIDKNGGFGKNGKLPWYIPEDLKYFKEMTKGRTLICGRVTAEGLPPLKGRNIVSVSRDGLLLREAIQKYPDAMIIGGAKLLQSAKPHIKKMYVTKLDDVYECDTYIDKDFFDGFKISYKSTFSNRIILEMLRENQLQ